MPLSEIERVVAARFARWGFELPPEGVTARAPGRILDHGWHIAWVWGEQDGEEYLELFSQHRMISDDHVRVWASGRVEELPAPSSSQVYSAGATQAEIAAGRDALFERNRRIYAELRETGLLPEPGNDFVAHDIQEGLSTGAVAPADPPAMDTQPVIKELDRDQLMTDAAIHAAATVELGDRPTFQERYLERALVSAISEYVAADTRPRERLPVPGWDPQPGDVDLTVRFAAERQPTILAELKVDDIEATLWDLLKLASIVRADPPAHAYLVAAAPPRRWQHAECADLFCDDGDPHVWGVAAIIERWKKSWRWLLTGGRARPQSIPARLETQLLACAPVDAFADYELRCTAVRVIDVAATTRFEDGWPAAGSDGSSPTSFSPPPDGASA